MQAIFGFSIYSFLIHIKAAKAMGFLRRLIYNFHGMRIWLKILWICAFWMSIIGLSATYWVGHEQESLALKQSEYFADSVEQLTLAGLTTLMVTNTMQHRAVFLEQIKESTSVRELKVIRGPAVEAQYGKAKSFEQAKLSQEEQVIKTGKEHKEIVRQNGKEFLYIIRPIKNSQNYLGKNCMACHFAKEDAVLGAIRMEIPLEHVNDMTFWFRFKLAIVGAILFGFVMVGIYVFIQAFINRPLLKIQNSLQRIESGDLTTPLRSRHSDELGEVQEGLESMRKKLSEIVQNIFDLSNKNNEAAQQVSKQASQLTDLSENLLESSVQSSSSVEELSASIESVAGSSHASAEGIRSIEKSIGQMNASVENMQNSVGTLKKHTEALIQSATEGQDRVERTIDAMEQIRSLGDRIGDITGLISDISDKTNLLALNASIEAARAGDAGRGFAVVADEITSLAEKTLQSVRDIGSLVEETRSTVENGSARVNKLAKAFMSIRSDADRITTSIADSFSALEKQIAETTKIHKEATRMSRMAQEIENSTREQSQNMTEIGGSVQEVSRKAGLLANSAQELATLAEKMAENTEGLLGTTRHFKT